MSGPRIVLACATRRGLRVLERLAQCVPQAEIVVFSFPEERHEPPFLNAIRELCGRIGAHLHVSRRLGAPELEPVWAKGFDLLLAVSWRYMIPRSVYSRATRGAFAFHDSLLPAYRGFSPTVWAIFNGEDHTGVTLFALADAVDSGDVVARRRVSIGPDETIAEVMERVTETYLALLEENLDALLAGTARLEPQATEGVSYVCRLLPADCEIDWRLPSRSIHDLVRGYTRPYPGAFTWLDGRRLIVWSIRLEADGRWVGRVPGRVAEFRPGEGAVVCTGTGAVLVTRVQEEGAGEEVAADRVLRSLSQTLGRG